MAVTVSGKNYTQISSCDTIASGGDWTDDIDTQDLTQFKEGIASLCGTMNNDLDIGTFTPTSSVDLSGTKHVRFWILSTLGSLIKTKANGGFQFWASDGTNTGYWYVAGVDTYPGGWYNVVVNAANAVDAGTKPTAMNAITSMGIRVGLTAAGKNVDDMWIDNLCICDGLAAYGDDAGGYFDLEDIYIEDRDTLGIGIVQKIGGQYFFTGSLETGDSGGINACKFQAKSNVLVFEDRDVDSNLYNITIVDNGTGITEFIVGSKAGTAGIEGCTIRVADTAQTPKFHHLDRT